MLSTLTRIMKENMFVFEMPKVVHIKNPALGLFYRSVQVFIFVYFVIFVMWWNKGYQVFDRSISGVNVEINGIAWLISEQLEREFGSQFVILDNGAYDFRAIANSGFYIVTNIRGIKRQYLGVCAESNQLQEARCIADEQCQVGRTTELNGGDADELVTHEIDLPRDASGIFTGKCDKLTKTCEIYGWCPTDMQSDVLYKPHLINPINILDEPYDFFDDLTFLPARIHRPYDHLTKGSTLVDVVNYTIFIQNAIEFPYYKLKRRNILPWMTEAYLQRCVYDPMDKRDKFCPVIRIGDIIRNVGQSEHTVLKEGAVLAILIDWDCDLDWSAEFCLPTYTFRQLDVDDKYNRTDSVTHGKGSTKRVVLHVQGGTAKQERLLLDANGIQFIILVTGRAGKFNLYFFTMRFGSGLALLGGATIVCDLVVFHFSKNRDRYKEATCDDKTLRRLLSMTIGSKRIQGKGNKNKKGAPRKLSRNSRAVPGGQAICKTREELFGLPLFPTFDTLSKNDQCNPLLECSQSNGAIGDNYDCNAPSTAGKSTAKRSGQDSLSTQNTPSSNSSTNSSIPPIHKTVEPPIYTSQMLK